MPNNYNKEKIKTTINPKILNIKQILTNNEKELLIISIPKIKLIKKVYNINSKLNNININVEILSSSDLNNNIFFLAAHSGNNINNYFNNLTYLYKEDQIYLKIGNKLYTYSVNNIYYINKTGYLEIPENISNTLVLITCSTTHKNKQLIIESKLISIKKM